MLRHKLISGEEVEVDESPEILAFIRRVRDLVNDPSASEDALVDVIYGKENRLLDQTIFEHRGAVTKEIVAKPAYLVLTDLLGQKRAMLGTLDVVQSAERYTMTVAEAAEKLGVHESAVRQAIAAGRLSSWKREGRHYLAPTEVENYQVSNRGPTRAPIEIMAGRDKPRKGCSFLVKFPGSEPIASQSWNRIAVFISVGPKARFFELKPQPDGDEEVRQEGFFVRGAFKVAKTDNNAARAGKLFREFEAR